MERSSDPEEMQVISLVESYSGLQEECHSRVQELLYWDKDVRDPGARRSNRLTERSGEDHIDVKKSFTIRMKMLNTRFLWKK